VTVLQALNSYYGRMEKRGEIDAPGYSQQNISFAIVLAENGTPIRVVDLRKNNGKRIAPASLSVPAAVKKSVNILPNLLWDETAYALGRTAGERKRTAQEHAAFKATNLALIGNSEDAGLAALQRFIESWTPEQFDKSPFHPEMLDANVVFRLDGEYGYIHDRPAAQALIGSRGGKGHEAFCLVTGLKGPIQRLHPAIKGVEGAQSSGASLVSFNLDAFESYNKKQGDNAPTSERAAFQYGTALNRLLDRSSSRNRIRIADETVVFWADAAGDEEAAVAAEKTWQALFDPKTGGNAAEMPPKHGSWVTRSTSCERVSPSLNWGSASSTEPNSISSACRPTRRGSRSAIGSKTTFPSSRDASPNITVTSTSSRRHISGARSRLQSSGFWSGQPRFRRNSTIFRNCLPARRCARC
jgi:CRISPR-associated protein Csd1